MFWDSRYRNHHEPDCHFHGCDCHGSTATDGHPDRERNLLLAVRLDPTNVVGISVSDTNDVVDLTGTFHVPPPPPRVIREFIVLADTTNAPARAMGRAAMEGMIDGSTNTVTVKVETIGLLVGTYATTITDTTGTNTYTLGTFDVHVWSNLVNGARASSRRSGPTRLARPASAACRFGPVECDDHRH